MMISNRISGLWSVIFLISTFNYISAQMNWSSWSRYSACSVSCGQGRQRRQRECIKTSPIDTGTCSGPKEMYAPCQMLACPKKKVLPCNCGCILKAETGQIMSQLPSKETKSCEWRITAKKGSTIALNITRLVLKAGWIRIASGKTTFLTLLKPGPEPKYPWKFKSEGNVMTVELLSYPDATGASHRNTYLSARYEQIEKKQAKRPVQKRSKKNNDKEPNVPAIIGITACVAIIILVAVFMAVRRHHRKQNAKDEADDGNDVVNLSSDYDSQGKARSNGSKEEKPLMDGKSSPSLSRPDRFMAQQQQHMMARPTFIQGRDSSYDSAHNPHQNIQANGVRLPNYPPEFYMKTPNYVPDPNFYRMMPVTTTGVMYSSPPQQPFVMHAPLPARSDHS